MATTSLRNSVDSCCQNEMLCHPPQIIIETEKYSKNNTQQVKINKRAASSPEALRMLHFLHRHTQCTMVTLIHQSDNKTQANKHNNPSAYQGDCLYLPVMEFYERHITWPHTAAWQAAVLSFQNTNNSLTTSQQCVNIPEVHKHSHTLTLYSLPGHLLETDLLLGSFSCLLKSNRATAQVKNRINGVFQSGLMQLRWEHQTLQKLQLRYFMITLLSHDVVKRLWNSFTCVFRRPHTWCQLPKVLNFLF